MRGAGVHGSGNQNQERKRVSAQGGGVRAYASVKPMFGAARDEARCRRCAHVLLCLCPAAWKLRIRGLGTKKRVPSGYKPAFKLMRKPAEKEPKLGVI